MELGQRIRQARLEAGLSQRQLCGEEITRNMLSQIENGSATPSVSTLRFLARQLGKPMGYFLEEESLTSPNLPQLTSAREGWDRRDYSAVLTALENWHIPDPAFDRERSLLLALSRCALAREAIAAGKLPYARQLLTDAETDCPYFTPAQERERLLLLAQSGENPDAILPRLPADDRELLLRAQSALASGDPETAGRLLDGALDHAAPGWNLLRGECLFAQRQWEAAARCYALATESPKVLQRLEDCWRELGDYRRAYEYACRLRKKP